MSNVFQNQSLFFPVPRALIDEGLLKDLPPSGVSLYLFLLSLAQKHSAVEIETVAYEVSDHTSMDAKSVKVGREALERAGLIACQKRQHGIIAYQLLNPNTREPLPPSNGRRGVRQHRPGVGRSARTVRLSKQESPPTREVSRQAYPPSWDEIGRDERGEPGEHEDCVFRKIS